MVIQEAVSICISSPQDWTNEHCKKRQFVLYFFGKRFLSIVPRHRSEQRDQQLGIETFMISPITRIDFSDYTELIPAFITIVIMIFTFNIGVGMTAPFAQLSCIESTCSKAPGSTGGHVGVRCAITAILYIVSLSIVHWSMFRSISEKPDPLFYQRSTGCHHPPRRLCGGVEMDEHRN